MAILDVVMNLLDSAGNVINPRKEDGHGSSSTNRTFVDTGLTQPTTPADTQKISAVSLPLPTGAAADTSVTAVTTSLGTDGATPPTIPGTGVRGWLRSIYDTLKATLTVQGAVTANAGTGTFAISAASLPLPTGAATSANQATEIASLSNLDGKIPDELGAWGYNAGTAGTLTVAANKRILSLTVVAPQTTAASMTINAGSTITVPAGTALTLSPRANLVAPTLVFTGTSSYFVEFVE